MAAGLVALFINMYACRVPIAAYLYGFVLRRMKIYAISACSLFIKIQHSYVIGWNVQCSILLVVPEEIYRMNVRTLRRYSLRVSN